MSYLDDLRSQAQQKLAWQTSRAQTYQRYYGGESPVIALLDTDERQTFTKFLRESQANWCELVVNAVAERLTVVGFQFGDSSDAAWALWQANCLDADAELIQTDALVAGSSYVLVQPDDTNPSGVSITGESPLEATVIYAPGNRRQRIAGYKRYCDWWDGDGSTTEVLITPDEIVTWPSGGGGPLVTANPAGVVSLVEMRPQPRTVGPPHSELDAAIPIQDRIHTTIFNRMVATDYGAFRQIWATGIRLARSVITSEDGTTSTAVTSPFDIGANRLLANENPEGHFGSFPESTLSGYLGAVAADVNHLAAITQTPPHYLLGQIANLSADAIKAAETGLVSKVSRRALHIGETWETVIRLALGMIGDPGAAMTEGEVIWADFETRSEGQRVDALVKMATLGVPQEVLWQRWGATPTEIEQWREMNAITPPTPPVTERVSITEPAPPETAPIAAP